MRDIPICLASSEDPVRELLLCELREQLESAIDQLPTAQQEVIRACYFDGERQPAAAKRLGIPDGTFRQRKTYALRTLRNLMAVWVARSFSN